MKRDIMGEGEGHPGAEERVQAARLPQSIAWQVRRGIRAWLLVLCCLHAPVYGPAWPVDQAH